MPELSRNAQVLRYLLDQARGVGHVKLAKFAYLADLEARRFLGQPISTFLYLKNNHGPFDVDFFQAERELTDGGWAVCSAEQVGRYTQKTLNPTATSVEYSFTAAEAEVLRFVAATYMGYTARDLCDDVVYQTEPMKAATNLPHGAEIPMDVVTAGAPDPLGFNLERLLASEAHAAAGQTRPAAVVFDELRSRVH